MSNADRFERGPWSLYVEFDPYEVNAELTADWFNGRTLGEKAEFEAYVLRKFGGLPEEVHEVLLHHEDGRIEISGGPDTTLDWLSRLMEWVCGNTSPREMKLVRNYDRRG